MKVINVELTVKPGEQAAYEAFINKLVTGSRSEAGNLSYNHFKKIGQRDRIRNHRALARC